MIIGKSFKFDAAHHLPSYPGKCQRLHGHTWSITVEVEGEVNDSTCMVMDLNLLSEGVRGVLDEVDHTCLNDHLAFERCEPTCEMLAEWLKAELEGIFSQALEKGAKVTVQVQEGEGGWARC